MTRPLTYTIEGNDRLSDILERLDKRLDQLDRTMAKVGQAAAGMGRHLDTAERKTKQLGDAAGQGQSKLDAFTGKLGEMTKKAGGYAAAVGAAALAAATAVAAAGAAFAVEKSRADALLAGQVGVSGDEAKRLGKVAGELYASGWAESAGEAANAVRSTMQNQLARLDVAREPLDRLSLRTAALARQMGEDFDRVTAAVSTMLRTRIAGSAEQAFDLLTAATQQGVDKSQDLLDTMTEYSVQFQALGIDAPRALGMMAQALNAGARNADVAADAIKEFAIRSKDGTKLSRDSFTALGLDADKMFATFARGGPEADKAMRQVLDRLRTMKDPVAQNAAVVGLFGTKAEDLQSALYAFDPTTAVAALGDVTDASDRFITSQESAGQRIDEAWRRVQVAAGDKLLPVIEKVLDKLDEWGRDPKIQQWLDELDSAINAVMPMLDATFGFMLKAFKDNQDTIFIGIIGLIAAVATFGAAIMGLVATVTYVAGAIHTVWKTTIDLILGYLGFFVNAAAKAFGWIPGLGPKLQEAADNFNRFRDKVNDALNGIKDKTIRVNVTGSGARYTQGGTGAEIPFGGGFQERAAGGPVWPGQVYSWNEQGREGLMLSGMSGTVITSQGMRAMESGEETIRLEIVVRNEDGQVIQEKLLKHKRQRGLASLGLG